jgi:hypothetical protein
MMTAYDPNTSRIITTEGANLFAYTYATDSYQQLGSASGTNGYWGCGVIDPKRKKFVTLGGGESGIYDISGGGSYSRQAFTTTGGAAIVAASYPGLAYDPVRDRITAYIGGTTVFSLNMDTRVWTSVNYPGGNPGRANGTGTYKRWNYSPALNVFVIVNNIDSNAWAFRFVVDSTAPSAPGNLAGAAASYSSVNLTWTASTDAESGIYEYVVRRGGQEVGRTSGLSFTDTGLAENTQYAYTVMAMNQSEDSSALAGPVSVTTPADNAGPVIVSTRGGLVNSATVVFNEPVEIASATNAANYTVNNGITVQSATLSADGMTVMLTTSTRNANTSYIVSISNVRDRSAAHNTVLPGTQADLSSALLVDFGCTASGNVFGLTGWDTVMYDHWNVYNNVGPCGINNNDRPSDFKGVIGKTPTLHIFSSGQKIVVTFYNNTFLDQTFTPKISFNDPDRMNQGTAGTWYSMSAAAIPPKSIGTSVYAFTSASAGAYSLVNVTTDAGEAQLICDKIELLSAGAGGTSIDMALPAQLGEMDINFFPNPFNSYNAIIFSMPVKNAGVNIYDASGKLVRAFKGVNGNRVAWNAGNSGSGIYFLKVTAYGKEYRKKLMVLR